MDKINYKFVFLNDVPFLYPSINVARQLEIEIWLNPKLLQDAFKISVPKKKEKPMYV